MWWYNDIVTNTHLINNYTYIDIDECTLQTDNCEQICHNTVGSYTCSCNTGYTESSDGIHCTGTICTDIVTAIVLSLLLLVDINECNAENGGCKEVCHNLPGSYKCECDTIGYELGSDKHSCTGMNTNIAAQWLTLCISVFACTCRY